MCTGNPNVDEVLRKRRIGLDVAVTFAVEGVMLYDASVIVEEAQEAIESAVALAVADALETISALDPENPALQDLLRGI